MLETPEPFPRFVKEPHAADFFSRRKFPSEKSEDSYPSVGFPTRVDSTVAVISFLLQEIMTRRWVATVA